MYPYFYLHLAPFFYFSFFSLSFSLLVFKSVLLLLFVAQLPLKVSKLCRKWRKSCTRAQIQLPKPICFEFAHLIWRQTLLLCNTKQTIDCNKNKTNLLFSLFSSNFKLQIQQTTSAHQNNIQIWPINFVKQKLCLFSSKQNT